ncbi:hypothetical protein RJ640_002028 [Escallonia rubra]|uniref:Pentatricopeptide repeat-containing protein n=1 Tax=Escallonia rubra TaxID=112253 RepID=A0AA88QDK3_9ASTE|nr:hypothetical protein RJ640_002028 [Escallonia rubra]
MVMAWGRESAGTDAPGLISSAAPPPSLLPRRRLTESFSREEQWPSTVAAVRGGGVDSSSVDPCHKPIDTISLHPSTFFPDLKPCQTLKDLSQVHAKFIKTGHIRDPLAAAELLRFSAFYHRNLRYARHIFDQMDPPNYFSWNTIIRALSESDDQNDDDPFQALVIFRLMLVDELVEPNRFTFPSVLKACAQMGRVEEGKQVHGMVVKIGLEDDEFVLSNLVRMYVMRGAMEYAHVLFNLNKVNVKRKTQMGGTVLWNVMVDGFVRNRDFRLARELFDEMPQRSVVSWNSMISGYAHNGLFKEAIELFKDMQMGDTRPNYVTLVSVLPVISRLGTFVR